MTFSSATRPEVRDQVQLLSIKTEPGISVAVLTKVMLRSPQKLTLTLRAVLKSVYLSRLTLEQASRQARSTVPPSEIGPESHRVWEREQLLLHCATSRATLQGGCPRKLAEPIPKLKGAPLTELLYIGRQHTE